MSRFIPRILAVCFTLALAISLTSCSREQKVEADNETPQATTVAAVRAERRELARELSISSEFHPFEEVDVHPKVAGYLKNITVDVGDRVRQGQLLGVLEVPELDARVQQATASERRAEAQVSEAREELQRAQSAHEAAHLSYARLSAVSKQRPNLVAQQEIDDAMARDRVSEAAISAAKASLAAAEQQVAVGKADEQRYKTLVNYSRITAPFSGVVTQRYADPGAMIQAAVSSQTQSMPLVRLSQNQTLRLEIPVPESAVPRIRLGTPVTVRVPSLGTSLKGKVARFSGQLDLATRTMLTEIDVPNPELRMMPGMFAEAVIALEQKQDALTVPVQAVIRNGDHASVMVVGAGNRLEQREVKLGIEGASRVEIVSGVRDNETVVIGSPDLKAGQLVQPKLVSMESSASD